MRRNWVVMLAAAAGACIGLLPSGGSPAAAAGSISIPTIKFCNGRHFNFSGNGCRPLGAPQTTFHSTVRTIFAYLSYSQWNGNHADQFQWYSPNGKLFHQDDPTPYTGSGPTTDCNYLSVAGTGADHLLGRWTFRVIVDGRPAASSAFQITAAANGKPTSAPVTPTAPATNCQFRATMAYYTWRLWRLFDRISKADDSDIPNGQDEVHTIRVSIDNEAQGIWDAVGRYEKTHRLPANWRISDQQMGRMVEDVYKSSSALEQDAINYEANTNPDGSTSVFFLSAPKAVQVGLADLNQLKILLNGTC